MENFFSAAEIAATRPTKLSVYQGKTYRMGWYSAGPLYLYNKEMFSQAGLDANTAPKTWDDLLNACDKLKSGAVGKVSVKVGCGPPM